MHKFLTIAVAFTVGTLLAAVHYERKIGDLKVNVEGSYHDGYRDASTVMEDEPGWVCQTMGNKICGPMPSK